MLSFSNSFIIGGLLNLNPTKKLQQNFHNELKSIIQNSKKHISDEVFNYILNKFTSSITIDSKTSVFDLLIKFFCKRGEIKHYNSDDECNNFQQYLKSNFSFIRFKNKPIVIYYKHVESKEKKESICEKIIIFTYSKYSQILFDFIRNIKMKSKRINSDKKELDILRNGSFSHKIPKRNLESIFIENEKKDLIVNSIDSFIKNESRYIELGLPYYHTILLYGEPGTGKTSLIKAIASHFNFSINYIPASNVDEDCFRNYYENSITVIEDIDSIKKMSNCFLGIRDNDDKEDSKNKENNNGNVFSEILNSLDGFMAKHKRIVIFTTNHIEKLNPALIRDGRINLKVEIGCTDNGSAKSFFDYYFKNNKLVYDDFQIKQGTTISYMQELYKQNKTAEEIMNDVKMICV